jgi:hypothetical protein
MAASGWRDAVSNDNETVVDDDAPIVEDPPIEN